MAWCALAPSLSPKSQFPNERKTSVQTITLELAPQEAEVLINLINIAVRAEGLNVAQAAVALSQRIQTAAQAAAQEAAAPVEQES